MIIYKLTNKTNGKVYVGQTKHSVEKRLAEHCRSEYPVGKALRKYGLENFGVEELATGSSVEELNQLEIDYIAKFSSMAPNGYNCDSGGKQKKPSANSILKLRIARKQNRLLPLDCQITKRDSGFRLRVYSASGQRLSLGTFSSFKKAYKKYRQWKSGRDISKNTCEVDFQKHSGKYRLRVWSAGQRKTIKSNFVRKQDAFSYFYKKAT